ncbi:hypothetical protein ACS0TY_013079 [Phlomoides rotata]
MATYKLPHGQQLLVDAPETIEKTRSWDGHNITSYKSMKELRFSSSSIKVKDEATGNTYSGRTQYIFGFQFVKDSAYLCGITSRIWIYFDILVLCRHIFCQCLGDLPFFSITENEEGADSSKKAQQATSITFSSRRPAILVDGTYATQSAAFETAFSSLVVVQGSLSAGMLSDKQLCEIKEIKVKAQIPQSQPDDLIDFYHLKSRKGMSQLVLENEVFLILHEPCSSYARLKYQNVMLADISTATTVAEGTFKNAYKDLYPHAAKIIPEWYAMERDLKNLSSPKS